jgi:predicted ester cyclase
VTATHTSELFGVAPTNRRCEIQGVLLFEFADGRISRERRVYDFTSLLIQVGVLKARPRD